MALDFSIRKLSATSFSDHLVEGNKKSNEPTCTVDESPVSSSECSSSNLQPASSSTHDANLELMSLLASYGNLTSPTLNSPFFPTSIASSNLITGETSPFLPATSLALSTLQKRRKDSQTSLTHEPESERNSPTRKSKPVPNELKDELYWERRRKNNDAAKRSRESRRMKEAEVAVRAAYLEQENLRLRAEIAVLKQQTSQLHLVLYDQAAQKR